MTAVTIPAIKTDHRNPTTDSHLQGTLMPCPLVQPSAQRRPIPSEFPEQRNDKAAQS